MKLNSVKVLNFRNIKDICVRLDDSLTVIVGKNNSGKTSFMKAIYNILENNEYNYYDYPLTHRKELIDSINSFKNKNYSENEFSFIEEIQKGASVIFNIDYSENIDSSELDYLSEFIIDLDPSVNNVVIEAKYSFMIKQDSLIELIKNYNKPVIDSNFINMNFTKLFKLQIFTHSIINTDDIRKVELINLKKVFKFCYLGAERFMDEAHSSSSKVLNNLIQKLFKEESENVNEDINKQVKTLKTEILNLSDNFQEKINNDLSNIVNEARSFTGYPGADELPLGVKSSIELLETLSESNLALVYRDKEGNELPNGNNGLGYKNLINIVLEIQNYIDSIDINSFVGIPLLVIEEPESHMHPQLQATFTKYIHKYLDEVSDRKLNFQILLTTHSSHIANSINFDGIRYFKKTSGTCIAKDLKQYADNDYNIKFLKKYMILSNCDIYFADKLIFIEGAGERLLMNNMIEKVSDRMVCNGDTTPVIPLKSQYISLIEVGGAHAYIFMKFVTFLGIPSLIITDLDPLKIIYDDKDGKKKFKKCLCKYGELSSNSTINRWYLKNITHLDNFNFSQETLPKDKPEVEFSKIMKMSDKNKKMDNIILAFQVKEPKTGYIGRSLEQAIIAANPHLYLDKEENIDEQDIENAFKSNSKMEFALELLMEKETQDSYFHVPEYIKQGLEMLANFDCNKDN